MLKCVRLVDLRHRAAFGGYYWDQFSTISSRISMFATWIMSTAITETLLVLSSMYVRLFGVEIRRRWPVGGMFVSPICSHFVDRITVRTSFGLFNLFYLINMHYAHIASDKGASTCERSVLSFVIRVLILHTKRTLHSATWSVNDSHFVNYGMIFVFWRVGYKSNYNLKTNRQKLINVLLG